MNASLLLPIVSFVVLSVAASGEVVDLTGTNNTGRINRAEFDWTPEQPTGTGLIQPFLRVQANTTEQGYNTSGGTPFDEKSGPWTHDLQLSDLKLVQIGKVMYYEFLLDINEPGGSKSLITLDRLEFYTSIIPSQTTTDVSSLGSVRLIYLTGLICTAVSSYRRSPQSLLKKSSSKQPFAQNRF